MIGSLSSLTVHAAAERSADASESSNACSALKMQEVLQSLSIRPAKMFFLPALGTVNRPSWIATDKG